MPAVPRRPASRDAHTARGGLAVCEFLMAFAVIVALAMLLMPAAPPRGRSAPAESGPTRYMLRDVLLTLQLRLEHAMVDTYDHCFHGNADGPVMVEIHPGLDTASASDAAEGDGDVAS